MKAHLRLLFYTLLILASSAAKAESLAIETDASSEIIETRLDKADVQQSSRFIITLKNGKTFELDATPNREDMKAALGLNMPEKLKQQILARGGTIEDVDPLKPFDSLSAANKNKFLEMRAMFLSGAARILSSGKVVMGAGSLVGEGLSFVKAKAYNGVVAAVKTTTGKQLSPSDYVYKKRGFDQRSDEAIAAALRGLDYKLWSQAPLVIESNEFGVSLSIGIVAESGVLRKGIGGAEELGFSLAFNKTSKSFVFELFHNSEAYDNSKAALSVVGVVGKAGVTMARRNGAETLNGSSFYPPAVPGYSTSSSDYFSAGLSSSIGLPPPPLADLLTVTNKSERRHLIRVTVSPVVKGYVRIQFGDVKGSIRIVTLKFVNAAKLVMEKVYLRGRSYCGPVFGA